MTETTYTPALNIAEIVEQNGGKIPLDMQKDVTMKDLIHYLNTMILKDGSVDCLCCRSHIETYKRTISRALIYWMTALRKMSKNGQKYLHFKDVDQYLYERLKMNASDYIILKRWELIEVRTKLDKKNKEVSTGEYTITQKGMDFLDGKIRVPKYVYLTNGRLIKTSPETISFIDAKNFDYEDLKQL